MSIAHETAELVRGRSGRVYAQIVLNREDAQALVAHLRAALSSRRGRVLADAGDGVREVRMRALLTLSLCVLAGNVLAQATEPAQSPDLPSAGQVEIALERDPMVRAAMSGIGYEQAQQQRLAAGSYEFTARADVARRRVTEPEIPGDFNEWGLALERPVRLPAKGSLDRDLGAQGVSVARLSAGDAMHEAGRNLLRLWFAWMKENAQLVLWQQQAELARQQQATVQKRKRAGDAPKMELNLAEAAALQSESNWVQARSREVTARGVLTRTFPAITVAEKATLAEPQALTEGLAFWNEQILNHNYQLAAARAEVRRRELLTKRADAERLPDPTVGRTLQQRVQGRREGGGRVFQHPDSRLRAHRDARRQPLSGRAGARPRSGGAAAG